MDKDRHQGKQGQRDEVGRCCEGIALRPVFTKRTTADAKSEAEFGQKHEDEADESDGDP